MDDVRTPLPEHVERILNTPLDEEKALSHWRQRLASFEEEKSNGKKSPYDKEFSASIVLDERIAYCQHMIDVIKDGKPSGFSFESKPKPPKS